MGSLKKNIFFNFSYQLLALFIPFITAPYLSRVLGAEGVGLQSYSNSIAVYFTYFTLMGLNKYGNRIIAECLDNKEARSRNFKEIYVMQAGFFIISLPAYIFYLCVTQSDKKAAFIQLIFVFSACFDINWFFFGLEQFKLTVIRNSVIKLLTVVCIFVFVKNSNDTYKYIFIMSFGTLLSQLCIWPFLKNYIIPVKIHIRDVIKHIKPNIVLFIPVIAVSIYRIMDKIMIGALSMVSNVGYYENAEKIINVPIALITAIGTVMLPRMTILLNIESGKESTKYIDITMFFVLAFANGITLGIIAVAKEFSVLFYGKSFEYTGTIMQYLAITIPFLAFGNVIRTQYLIPRKKDNIYLISAILGAVTNVIVNLLLIPKYDAVGAAIGTICTEIVVCVYQLVCIKKEIHLLAYIKLQVVYLFMAILMYLVICLIPLYQYNIITLAVKTGVGILFYGVVVGVFWYRNRLKIKL